MTTVSTPSERACLVSSTVSVSAATPVPGISRSGATPARTAASSSALRSPEEKELASPVVPSSAMPSHPSASR